MSGSDSTAADFDDELLSAYVDGELTAEERAAVESRLARDPQAARLVEELRVLSATIKALPREKLGRDLRADVLAAAGARGGRLTLSDTSAVERREDRMRGIRRGLAWSAVAIAATLMLMVVQPAHQQRDAGTVAQGSKEEAKNEVKKAEESRADATASTSDRDSVRQMPSLRAADGSSNIASSEPLDESLADAESEGRAAPAAAAAGAAMAPPETAQSAAPLSAAAESNQLAASEPSGLALKEEEASPENESALARAPSSAEVSGRLAKDDVGAEPERPVTVELLLKTPESQTRLEQLLVESNIELVDDVADKTKADQPTPEAVEEKSRVENNSNVQPDGLLVEATPRQVDALVARYRQDADSFQELSVEDGSEQVDSLAGNEPRGGQARYARRNGGGGGFGGGRFDSDERESESAASTAPATDAPRPLSTSGKEVVASSRAVGQREAAGRAWRYFAKAPASGDELTLGAKFRESELLLRELRDGEEVAGQPAAPADAKAPKLGYGLKPAEPARNYYRARQLDGGEQVQVLILLRRVPPAPVKKAAN